MAKETYSDTERLTHIIDHARFCITHTAEVDPIAFEENRLLRQSVCFSVEKIGEAAAYLGRRVKAKWSLVDWDALENLRHLSVHEYFELDYRAVYHTIRTEFPNLILDVQAILADDFGVDL